MYLIQILDAAFRSQSRPPKETIQPLITYRKVWDPQTNPTIPINSIAYFYFLPKPTLQLSSNKQTQTWRIHHWYSTHIFSIVGKTMDFTVIIFHIFLCKLTTWANIPSSSCLMMGVHFYPSNILEAWSFQTFFLFRTIEIGSWSPMTVLFLEWVETFKHLIPNLGWVVFIL